MKSTVGASKRVERIEPPGRRFEREGITASADAGGSTVLPSGDYPLWAGKWSSAVSAGGAAVTGCRILLSVSYQVSEDKDDQGDHAPEVPASDLLLVGGAAFQDQAEAELEEDEAERERRGPDTCGVGASHRGAGERSVDEDQCDQRVSEPVVRPQFGAQAGSSDLFCL